MADYDDEGEGLSGKVAEISSAVAGHAKLILLAVLLLGLVGYYFFLYPKPVSARVSVREIDAFPIEGAEVVFEDDSGNTLGAAQLTDPSGTAFFSNLPPRSVRLRARAGMAYGEYYDTADLSGSGDKIIAVLLEKKNDIRIAFHNIPTALSEGCSDNFVLAVANGGEDPFETEIAIEGNALFAGAFSAPDGKKTVFPKESENFTIRAAVPKVEGDSNTATGKMRVKRTTKEISFGIPVDSLVRPSLSPSEVRFQKGGNPVFLMSLENTGKQPLSNIAISVSPETNLKAYCGEDGSQCFKLERLAGGEVRSLAPQSKLDFGLRITQPTEIPPGDYLAQLVVRATCLNSPGLSAPIYLDLKNPQ
ncbi:hypothetical protein HY995_05340 [Candidatus Micrarchaeota archaeon]|nr:hypothetical protein [Candidatus Micrarchaeota archaeon]